MRRVLLVVDSLDGGGAERHVVDLACALAERGNAVHVACSAAGVRRTALDAAGVPVSVLGGQLVKRRTCPAYARELHRLIAALQPDVVHAHVHASEVAAALALEDSDLPLVLTEHTEAPWRTADDLSWAALACARADLVLAVSSAVSRGLQERLELPASRVRLVLPAVLPAPRSPRTAGPPTVGYVGRLVPEKGVDLLLEAFAALRGSVPTARLRVVGDGPERARLTRLAGPGVELLGYRPDARALLASMDVLAVPSRSDGSPLVVAEAQAAGVVVVASRVGGLPDRVRSGVDGLLVPPGEPEVLAAALCQVLTSPALQRRLTAAGSARAAQETHAAMVDEVERAYDAALASASTASQNLWRTGVV